MFSRRQIAIGLLKLLLGVFAALIVLVLVLMVLFTEENWRGRRVLVRCEEGLRARGEKLELASFIPPPVAEAENFWMAPLLVPLATATQEELDRKPKAPGSPLQRLEKIDLSRAGDSPKMPRSGDYELGQPIDLVAWQRYLHQDTRQNPTLDQREAAHAVLAWLGRWSAELDEFSAAASRPSARFPLDYSKGFGMPMPHLMLLTRFAQVYRLRCVAAFEAGNIAFALQDLQTSDQIQAAIRSEPLLISYLVRLTMIKSLMQPIWQGLVERVWDEDQLQDIQAALARIDLISDYAWVARGERAVANLTYS